MVGKLIIRGLIVGIIAGLLAFGFARTFGEGPLSAGIAFEEQTAKQEEAEAIKAGKPPAPEEPEIVSRENQSGLGLMTGTVGLGAGLGCLFGILFAFGNGRLGNMGPGPTAATLAAIGFVTLYLVPALKFPANPPGTNEGDTIAFRTGLYFLIMAISVAASVIGLMLQRRLSATLGSWNGSLAAAAVYLAIIVAAYLIVPGYNETPDAFKATTMWDFRLASVGIQAVIWATLGAGFGTLSEMAAKGGGRAPAGRPVAA